MMLSFYRAMLRRVRYEYCYENVVYLFVYLSVYNVDGL